MLRQSPRVTALSWDIETNCTLIFFIYNGLPWTGEQCYYMFKNIGNNVLSFCFSFKGTGFCQHMVLLTSDCLTGPKNKVFQAKNATRIRAEMCRAGSTIRVLWRTPLQCTGITIIWKQTGKTCLWLNQWDIKFKHLQHNSNSAHLKWQDLPTSSCSSSRCGEKQQSHFVFTA